MSHSGKQIRQRKKIKDPEHSLGNWNNWKHSLEFKKDQFQEKLMRVVLGTLNVRF